MNVALDRLDQALVTALSRSPEPFGARPIYQLVTTGTDGRPHVSFLGDAEVHAPDVGAVTLLVWARSSAATNLSDRRAALLVFLEGGAFVKVDLDVTEVGTVTLDDTELLLVRTAVTRVLRDRVPYADIVSGPTFELVDQAVQARWAQAAEVLRAPGG